MSKKILVIAAHPDDEVLGCGGMMKKHSTRGDEVFVLILTNGSTVRYGDKMTETLQENAESCGKILGVKDTYFRNLPEQKLDGIPLLDIIQEIEKVIDEVKPDIIYTTHKGDINQDHRAVFEATMIAVRPVNKFVKEIYSYEIISSTEWGNPFEEIAFLPNVFMNIEQEVEDKISAFKKYESQVNQWPHSRSEKGVRTLAQYRGMQSNMPYAEAFVLIRKISQ